MPDLMIENGQIQPKAPFYVVSPSCGQYSLANTTRAWTKLWLAMLALGWQPRVATNPAIRCLHQVRVSFRFGTGSCIEGLICNPRFYELVMGWPIGWTAPGEPVTGFAQWLLRSRIALSRLTMPPIGEKGDA